MKVILSRKGFDSGSGGCASPILPDGHIISLPIPDRRGGCRYADIGDGSLGRMAEELSRMRVRQNSPAHLDPDLVRESRPRLPGWRGSLGQTGSARAHLEAQGVGPGDVFLFFGWFRHVSQAADGKWRFAPGDAGVHAVFGWLQVAEVLDLSDGGPGALRHHPWLKEHPHLNRGQERGNTVFVGAEELVLGGRRTSLPGYGCLPRLTERSTLTCPGCSRSRWKLPGWFLPPEGRPTLTYHADRARWVESDGSALLSTVGRGQEFVLDCEGRPEAEAWIGSLLGPDA